MINNRKFEVLKLGLLQYGLYQEKSFELRHAADMRQPNAPRSRWNSRRFRQRRHAIWHPQPNDADYEGMGWYLASSFR